MPDLPPLRPTPVYKLKRSRARRLLRLIGGVLDPRAYFHALRLINYYNYSRVIPRRILVQGNDCNIGPDAVFSDLEHVVLGERVTSSPQHHDRNG